jgi:phosphoglucosamine mutase
MLESALAAGLAAEGINVALLGVVPTPVVARACAQGNVAGAVVSASHNPFADNGIKLFAPGGRKLPDLVERRIEAEVATVLAEPGAVGPTGPAVGVIDHDPGTVRSEYLEWLVSQLPVGALRGLSIVVDAANGAASAFAGEPFRRLGAVVHVINDSPDGCNINDACGATHTEELARVVVERGADVGIALDGDADRCIAVDAMGVVVDGDRLIAVCARDRLGQGRLTGGAVVVTVMANLGFRRAMAGFGIELVETPVGDRYVLEALDDRGLVLGGEQSGHVIFRDLATTGDGLLTALQVLAAVQRRQRSFTEVSSSIMARLPQVLVNVSVKGASPSAVVGAMAREVQRHQALLGDDGRVLVRASGTEPLVRVMVEALDAGVAQRTCEELAQSARDVQPSCR